MAETMGPGALQVPRYQSQQTDAVAPKGWERTIKKMKKSGTVDNPWALAWWMKKRGMHPAKKKMAALLDAAGSESRSIQELLQAAGAGDVSAQAQCFLALMLVRDLQKES